MTESNKILDEELKLFEEKNKKLEDEVKLLKEELNKKEKEVENLEKISSMRHEQRQQENSDDEDDKIKISSENINLDSLDIHVIEEPKLELFPDLLIDAEVLE